MHFARTMCCMRSLPIAGHAAVTFLLSENEKPSKQVDHYSFLIQQFELLDIHKTYCTKQAQGISRILRVKNHVPWFVPFRWTVMVSWQWLGKTREQNQLMCQLLWEDSFVHTFSVIMFLNIFFCRFLSNSYRTDGTKRLVPKPPGGSQPFRTLPGLLPPGGGPGRQPKQLRLLGTLRARRGAERERSVRRNGLCGGGVGGGPGPPVVFVQ